MQPDSRDEQTGGSPVLMTKHWSGIMAAGSRSNPDTEKALDDQRHSYRRGLDRRRKTLENDESAERSPSTLPSETSDKPATK